MENLSQRANCSSLIALCPQLPSGPDFCSLPRPRGMLESDHRFSGVRRVSLRRYIHYCAVTTAVLLAASLLPAQASPPSASPRVSMNQIWSSLPDFVCNEKLVSSLVENGKTKQQRVIESVYMIHRKE